jgi:hypothetical protein
MNPDSIPLDNVSKLFEYEKISREIDSIEDIEAMRNIAKLHIKLYFKQQEIISKL